MLPRIASSLGSSHPHERNRHVAWGPLFSLQRPRLATHRGCLVHEASDCGEVASPRCASLALSVQWEQTCLAGPPSGLSSENRAQGPRLRASARPHPAAIVSPPARCASGRAGTGAPGTFLGVHLRGGASHRAQTPPAPRGPGPPPPPGAAPAGKGPVRAADGRRPPTPGTAGAPQPPAGPPRPARSRGRSGGGAGLLFLAAAAEAHGVAAAQTASSSAVAAEEEAGEEG